MPRPDEGEAGQEAVAAAKSQGGGCGGPVLVVLDEIFFDAGKTWDKSTEAFFAHEAAKGPAILQESSDLRVAWLAVV